MMLGLSRPATVGGYWKWDVEAGESMDGNFQGFSIQEKKKSEMRFAQE